MPAAALVLVMTLAAADAPTPPDGVSVVEAEMVDAIEGEWEVVSLQCSGKDLTEKIKGHRLAFTHDRAKATDANHSRPVEAAYRLDRSKPMPEIDLIGSGGEVISRGVFACPGDSLVWAESMKSDGPRPKGLSSEAGSGVQLWTLHRVKK
jgi:uncharacterized protein (TIGR03067 family)